MNRYEESKNQSCPPLMLNLKGIAYLELVNSLKGRAPVLTRPWSAAPCKPPTQLAVLSGGIADNAKALH